MEKELESVVRLNVLQMLQKESISLHEMALELQMDPAHLSRVLSGKRNVTFRHIELFASYFHISAAELVSSPQIEAVCKEDQSIEIKIKVPYYDAYKRVKHLIQNIYQL